VGESECIACVTFGGHSCEVVGWLAGKQLKPHGQKSILCIDLANTKLGLLDMRVKKTQS